VASAFVSYAHEDQEFVFALVQRLRGYGLDIRFDAVVLRIGDSLIGRISEEIKDGDFLIAIVSPDSLKSEWCKKELALAANQGIQERRIKVLPVKFRNARMPPMLEDTLWGDADSDDIETLAHRLAVAMKEHLEGREGDAARKAAEVEEAGGEPAHAEIAGDVDVAAIEDVADRVWDVFAAWAGIWAGGNVRDLEDPQRRLRWALDKLPDHVRAGLTLMTQLAEADWDEFFADREREDAEREIREELRSVRTQVAQGLPVTRRWTIADYLGEQRAHRRDALSYLWELQRGDATKAVEVIISRTVLMSENEHLTQEVAQAKETKGRSALVTLLAVDDPSAEVVVTTEGISLTLAGWES
jgi:TIR domain